MLKHLLVLLLLFNFKIAIAESLSNISQDLLQDTLFGFELTAQDEQMINERGRAVITTDHKEIKNKGVAESLFNELLKLDSTVILSKGGGKHAYEDWPWFRITSRNNELSPEGIEQSVLKRYDIHPDPVCIEVSTPPLHFKDVERGTMPVFSAFSENGLKPYLKPAAERSGMGHIHIGGKSLRESPFYKYPKLLRNMLVYFHQHPSLLWGFAEAYDIGLASNIETLHDGDVQLKFDAAIQSFDSWVEKASPKQLRENGLFVFLEKLKQYDAPLVDALMGVDRSFYKKYRFINLSKVEHASQRYIDLIARATIEFRNFRPAKNAQVAKAQAALLLVLMDKLKDKNISFKEIGKKEFEAFYLPTKIQSDWETVKQELELDQFEWRSYWDSEVRELVDVPVLRKIGSNFEIRNAFSEKEWKGTRFEIRTQDEKISEARLNGKKIEFHPVRLGDQQFSIAMIDSHQLRLSPKQLIEGKVEITQGKGSFIRRCISFFDSIF